MKKNQVYLLAAAALVVSVVVELLFAQPHHHQLWHTMPGADILIGFVGCAALIFVAKIVLGPLLHRDETYYEGGEGDE